MGAERSKVADSQLTSGKHPNRCVTCEDLLCISCHWQVYYTLGKETSGGQSGRAEERGPSPSQAWKLDLIVLRHSVCTGKHCWPEIFSFLGNSKGKLSRAK